LLGHERPAGRLTEASCAEDVHAPAVVPRRVEWSCRPSTS
jgi:hypothetical protein